MEDRIVEGREGTTLIGSRYTHSRERQE